MTDPRTLYDTDFLAWTEEQAEALRGGARTAPSGGTNRALDWENLAEEVEDLGKSQRSALASQIRRILVHLFKLEFSPAEEPRDGWIQSVEEGRAEVEDLVGMSPSLRRELRDVVGAQLPRARRMALSALERRGEARRDVRAGLGARAYDPQIEVLSDWLPPRFAPGALP